jgi:adenylate cyclase, class 2
MASVPNAPQAHELAQAQARRANLEIKARCRDLSAARAVALRLGAEPALCEEQQDTYFATARGRLKLRETSSGRAELIPYLRPDRPGVRRSDYRVIEVRDGEGTRALLGEILGVVRTVRKRREVLLWRNVRIHLDRVEGLGSFLELEAVFDGSPGAEALQRDAVDRLLAELGIAPDACLAGSYESLLGSASPAQDAL